jgi:hypothetical protein
MSFGEMRWGGVDWIDLVQDMDKWRALNTPINLRVPQNARKFLSDYVFASV